LLCYSIKTMIY